MFPDSVLEKFGRLENYRIVVLIRKGLSPGIKNRFNGKNFVIEEFEENHKKNFLQRVFYFFYSYLIFTDTTKLVSSYGVRADKPRSIFKYWNYPFKLFIARVLGRSDLIKNTLVPYLYMKIFPARPYAYLFDKYKPDIVFLTGICLWPVDLEFLVDATRRNIKTIGMPGNWDHLSKYFVPFKPDNLLVWSRQVKYEALQYQGYTDSEVKIVGAPQIDFMIKQENLIPRRQFLEKLNFPQDSKILTFFSQGPYSLDGADLVDMILKWIAAGKLDSKLKVIIRPHPSGLMELEKYLPFQNNPSVYIDKLEGWSTVPNVLNYMNILHHSDVVLTTYSSIATEASIFDRPTIIASFDGYKERPIYQSVKRHARFTHFQYLLKFGGIKVTESGEELLRAIGGYLSEPKKDHEARMKLREEVFGYFDGGNSDRIVNEVIN